jgi:hypothetical protein
MKKPKLETMKYLDYSKCAKFIEHKLGYQLRDTLGKFSKALSEDIEYRDYWHFICDACDISNGSLFYLPMSTYGEDWQKEITKAFEEEFGADAEYMASW